MLVGGPSHIQSSAAWRHKIYKEPHHSLELKQQQKVSLKKYEYFITEVPRLFECTPNNVSKILLTAKLQIFSINLKRVWHNINTFVTLSLRLSECHLEKRKNLDVL